MNRLQEWLDWLQAWFFVEAIYTRRNPFFPILAGYTAYNLSKVMKNASDVIGRPDRYLAGEEVKEDDLTDLLKNHTLLADWAVEFFASAVRKEKHAINQAAKQAEGIFESVIAAGTVVVDAAKKALQVLTPAEIKERDLNRLRMAQGVLVLFITDAATKALSILRTLSSKSLPTVAFGVAAGWVCYNLYQIAQNGKEIVKNPDHFQERDGQNITLKEEVIKFSLKTNTVYFDRIVDAFGVSSARRYLWGKQE